MAKRREVVGAGTVREWFAGLDSTAREAAGLADATVGVRGKLSTKVIDAFNAAHKGQAVHTQGVKVVETIKVSGTRVNAETGRKTPVTRSTTLAEIRAWAMTQDDLKVGAKGRISSEVTRAFAERAPK